MAANYELQEVELACPICFEDYDQYKKYRQPKLLMCLHTFCYGCMKALRKLDGSLICSMCRTTHTVNKISELYDNYVIYDYLRRKQELEDEKFACKLSEEFKEQERRQSDSTTLTNAIKEKDSPVEVIDIDDDSVSEPVVEGPGEFYPNAPPMIHEDNPNISDEPSVVEEIPPSPGLDPTFPGTYHEPIITEPSEMDSDSENSSVEDVSDEESSSSSSTENDTEDETDETDSNSSQDCSTQQGGLGASDVSVEEQESSVIVISEDSDVLVRAGPGVTVVGNSEEERNSKRCAHSSAQTSGNRNSGQDFSDEWATDEEDPETCTENLPPYGFNPELVRISTNRNIRNERRYEQPHEDCCLQ